MKKNKKRITLIELLILIILIGMTFNIIVITSKKEYKQKYNECFKKWESTDYCDAILR